MYIAWYGTHGACPCFQGFSKPFEGQTSPTSEISGVSPEDFKVGDELVLEFDLPINIEFDFALSLRINAGLLSAFVHSFDEKNSLNTKELEEQMGKRVGPAMKEVLVAPVVRFHEKPASLK
jgi:hypothetical protein